MVKYAVVINTRVRNTRVVMVLKKIHGNENFVTKFLARMLAGNKQAESASATQKWVNVK